MPRPKNYILFDLFDRHGTHELLCNNGNCSGKLLKMHTGNLERHLQSMHPELYIVYMEQKHALKNSSKIIERKAPYKELRRELNKTNIGLAIVELFTKNARPLCLIRERAFKVLLQPAFEALNIAVNEHYVNEQIIAFSQQIKRQIMRDLNGKLLSLKVDIATREGRSVLGVNAQYIKDNGIQVKTLAVKELKLSHTSFYLKSVILGVLEEYAIDLSQILTITTENGANVLNAVKDLNDELKIALQAADAHSTSKMESALNGWHEDGLQTTSSTNATTYNIIGLRCGAYTLQLCVQDVLRRAQIKDILEKCRTVVRKLRTNTYAEIFKHYDFQKPKLDCTTRWHTTYNMLQKLLEIQNVIDLYSAENAHLCLSADDWQFVSEFVTVFKPVYNATVKLQTEQLWFSELYIIIMDIIFQLENLPPSELSKLLINALNNQKSKLFEHSLFNAAVFLDPRIKICMDSVQKTRAKECITVVHERISALKSNPITFESSENSLAASIKEEPAISISSPKSFYEYLQNLGNVDAEPMTSSLEADILLYDRQARLPLNSNIIDYWSTQNNLLSVVAKIILVIPFTEISVTRLYSDLKYIKSAQCDNLTGFNLEHVLRVKHNGVFNYET